MRRVDALPIWTKRVSNNDRCLYDGPGPSCGMLSGKQEAKMNWVKCTDTRKQPIYVNIENATSILWNEIEKTSLIAFAHIGGDTIGVIEKPEAIIRGQ